MAKIAELTNKQLMVQVKKFTELVKKEGGQQNKKILAQLEKERQKRLQSVKKKKEAPKPKPAKQEESSFEFTLDDNEAEECSEMQEEADDNKTELVRITQLLKLTPEQLKEFHNEKEQKDAEKRVRKVEREKHEEDRDERLKKLEEEQKEKTRKMMMNNMLKEQEEGTSFSVTIDDDVLEEGLSEEEYQAEAQDEEQDRITRLLKLTPEQLKEFNAEKEKKREKTDTKKIKK